MLYRRRNRIDRPHRTAARPTMTEPEGTVPAMRSAQRDDGPDSVPGRGQGVYDGHRSAATRSIWIELDGKPIGPNWLYWDGPGYRMVAL
jgi:hypothetical protein